jgi:hypothetical protein
MPTYINSGTENLSLDLRTIPPSGILVTEFILDTTGTDLTKTSDEPYFNPVTAVNALTSTGPGDNKTITLESDTNIIEIKNLSATVIVTVFLQSTANTPGIPILPGELSKEIAERDYGKYGNSLKNKVQSLIFQFSAAMPASTFYVVQRKY